jgi:ribonuclease HI
MINLMDKEKIIIYTDGSSLGNPGSGGWGAVISLPDSSIVELGGAKKNTTNNRMELTAAIEALLYVKKNSEEIILYTDSNYIINGITKWVDGWISNKWIKRDKKSVLNRDLWEKLVLLTDGKKISWRHISGHSGLSGNERADDIATSFADGSKPKLFKGAFEKYDINIFDVSYDEKKKRDRSATRDHSRTRAYSYLSLVDGVLARHGTWEECEKRVKGKKRTKYRKAVSLEDEKAIKKDWKV